MTPDDVTAAIVQAILRGGMQWVVSTVAALLPAMWAITVIFHLARPYMLRTIRKLSLRFGADIWWLGYVLVRDAVMLITFSLSLIFLFPNLMMTIPLPLTAPLAGVLLFASLYVKLLYDSDDDFQAYRVSTLLLAVGAAFYFVPQIFAIESTSQGWLSGVGGFLTSTSNAAWMGPIVVFSLLGYAAIGSLIFYQVAITGRRFGQRRPTRETPRAA
jgi:hypothetical protein